MSQRDSYAVMPSPVGELTLRWADDALVGLYFDNASILQQRNEWTRDDALLLPVRTQLEEYFRGERRDFDVPLRLAGTELQKSAWEVLRGIPCGTAISYGEQAKRIGRADWSGARAVGAANGQNPIAIIVPCHRVIGANGKLIGFGGGLAKKEWLLDHENVDRTPKRPQLTLW